MKKDFTTPFQTVLHIAEKHGLNTEKITLALAELPDFRITAPIIGGFSTGKSSLINAVIGQKLLSTNITPETAVATEITNGNDTVTLVESNGKETTLPLSEFDTSLLAATKYALVRIQTSNPFFREISSVKLVDMPGFDSGIDVHNKAIDDYLPKSLAYILTVAADEGTLRESIIRFLNELKLYNMPVYTVITKSDKVEPETIEQLKVHISETIRRFLKIENPKIAVTTRNGHNVDGFRDFLLELQNDSENLIQCHFGMRLGEECIVLEKYLTDRLSQKDMSLEDIKLREDQIRQNMKVLTDQLAQEKQSFHQQMNSCIASIQNRLSNSLKGSSTAIASLLLQNGDVQGKINSIVRNAVTTGVQSDLEPKARNYVRKAAEMIEAKVYGSLQVDVSGELSAEDVQKIETVKDAVVPLVTTAATELIAALSGGAVGGAAATLGASALITGSAVAGTSLATAIGIGGSLAGPIGAAIGAAAGILISGIMSSSMKQKKEEERRSLAQQRANEIIAQIIPEASAKVEAQIMAYVDDIDQKIEEEIAQKRALLEKSLADTAEQFRLGTEEREREMAELQADLETIRGIRNGI